MQVKKFIGKDMQDALIQVKEQLGSDAIVFGSRQIRPKGMFGPTEVEVTAAVDDVAPPAATASVRAASGPRRQRRPPGERPHSAADPTGRRDCSTPAPTPTARAPGAAEQWPDAGDARISDARISSNQTPHQS